MTLKLYDKQGNVEFDSTNVTLGLIKSCPVNTYYPAWITDFILMYGHIINPQKFNFDLNEVKRQKKRLGNGYLDILDVMNAREKIAIWLVSMVDFSAPVRLRGISGYYTKDDNRADVTVRDNGSVSAAFLGFENSSQNNPSNNIYNYDTGRFVRAFNQALDDDYFGFKSPTERVNFIRDFVRKHKYFQFADEGQIMECYVDIERDICPIAFLGANGAWHKKMNFEWSADAGGYPLISFYKVSRVDGKWRFHFSSAFFLSATELSRFGVYFFDLYSQKETKVGLNTYDRKGNLTFSTAQPPLKAVYVNLPELKSVDKIVEPTKGWTLNNAKDVAFYSIGGERSYATLCTYGVANYGTYRGRYVGGYHYKNYGNIIGSIDSIGIKGGVALFISPVPSEAGNTWRFVKSDMRSRIESFVVGDGAYIKDQKSDYHKFFSGHVTIDTTYLPFPYN